MLLVVQKYVIHVLLKWRYWSRTIECLRKNKRFQLVNRWTTSTYKQQRWLTADSKSWRTKLLGTNATQQMLITTGTSQTPYSRHKQTSRPRTEWVDSNNIRWIWKWPSTVDKHYRSITANNLTEKPTNLFSQTKLLTFSWNEQVL